MTKKYEYEIKVTISTDGHLWHPEDAVNVDLAIEQEGIESEISEALRHHFELDPDEEVEVVCESIFEILDSEPEPTEPIFKLDEMMDTIVGGVRAFLKALETPRGKS